MGVEDKLEVEATDQQAGELLQRLQSGEEGLKVRPVGKTEHRENLLDFVNWATGGSNKTVDNFKQPICGVQDDEKGALIKDATTAVSNNANEKSYNEVYVPEWIANPEADLRVAYSTSPGMGPIMSCCLAGHLGSGVGQPDLNQYFPFPCLLVRATMESSFTSSRDGFTEARGFLITASAAEMVALGLERSSNEGSVGDMALSGEEKAGERGIASTAVAGLLAIWDHEIFFGLEGAPGLFMSILHSWLDI